MPRWVMKHYVEGALGVQSDLSGFTFKHPSGRYEVHLENSDMRPGAEVPLLLSHIIFDAPTIDDAETEGERLILRFLDLLSFSTRHRFRVQRTFCLVSWDGGEVERSGHVYGIFPNADLPQLLLGDEMQAMLELLCSADGTPVLRHALRWFSNGVAEDYVDDQFEMLWLSIEALARLKAPGRVPDQCSKCQDPLFCRKCNEVKTHRPYPKQKIKMMFDKFAAKEPERTYRAAFDMRNALAHGDDLDAVEKEHGVTVSQMVDEVGHVAWAALMDAVASLPRQAPARLHSLEPSTLVHRRTRFKVSFSGPSLGREPQLTDLPTPDTFKVRMIVDEDRGPEIQ